LKLNGGIYLILEGAASAAGLSSGCATLDEASRAGDGAAAIGRKRFVVKNGVRSIPKVEHELAGGVDFIASQIPDQHARLTHIAVRPKTSFNSRQLPHSEA